MEMSKLLNIIHRSLLKTNTLYSKWANGWWVTAYGVEGFVVGRLVQDIMAAKDHAAFATLETDVQALITGNGLNPAWLQNTSNRQHNETTENMAQETADKRKARLDLVLYNAQQAPTYAIEVKRWWNPACIEDLNRLCMVRQKMQQKGLTPSTGVFVLLEATKASNKEKVQEKMHQTYARHTKLCTEAFQNKNNTCYGQPHRFSYGVDSAKPTIADNGWAFSSFCVVIGE